MYVIFLPLMVLKKLEYAQNNVVGIAESRGFGLFRVMQATHPIDGDVGLLFVQFHRSRYK